MSKTIDDIVVVKVGTSVLADTYPDGRQQLNIEAFERIGRDIIALEKAGTHVALVTSAAITAGMAVEGLSKRPDRDTEMSRLQMLSSVGWAPLVNTWSAALLNRTSGSLQLTKNELNSDAPERVEALQTTHALFSNGATPIVNENDAIAHAEIAFGDNDTLAAIYAACIGQSSLFGDNIRVVLLSDVHGVYENKDDPNTVISSIDDVDAFIHLAGESSSENGTGGMTTKFSAAKIVTEAGMKMWIAHGRTENAIQRALTGEIGTVFLPKNT